MLTVPRTCYTHSYFYTFAYDLSLSKCIFFPIPFWSFKSHSSFQNKSQVTSFMKPSPVTAMISFSDLFTYYVYHLLKDIVILYFIFFIILDLFLIFLILFPQKDYRLFWESDHMLTFFFL